MKNKISKVLSSILSILLVMSLVVGCGNKATSQKTSAAANDKNIVVLYTNDVHCGTEDNIGYAGLANYKKSIDQNENYVALVDAGDFSQGAPIGTLSNGKYLIDIMKKVGYDFCCPGNHEFDYGMENFLSNCLELNNIIFCCNFIDLRTNSPVLNPYKMMTFGNKKVAFVGAVTPEAFTKSTPAYFQDGNGNYIYSLSEDESGKALYASVQKAVDEARGEGADYVILVGHFGEDGTTARWKTSAIVQNTNNIDFVIDGHSHEVYNKTFNNKDGKPVQVSQTGTKLNNIGKLTISKDGNISAETVTMADVSSSKDEKGKDIPDRDADVTQYIKNITDKLSDSLNQVIVYDSPVDLIINEPGTETRIVRSKETNLGDLAADAYRIVLGADIGFMNGGGLRKAIKAGNITYNDCLTVMPFNNMATMIKCKGQVIKDALELGASRLPEENGGFIHVSGLTYTIDTSIESTITRDDKENYTGVSGEYRVRDIKVGGVDIDLNKDYTVACHDYMLINGGDGFTMFKGSEVLKDRVLPDVDVLVDYLKAEGTAGYSNPYGEGRITIK